ncbi:MAG: CaiB/BaiF CoA transferase family protein [Gemmataceae bacterium]
MSRFRHDLLKDVRILDASRVLAGPFCGQLLGDLGADVIKIERPGKGDETRGWGPPYSGPLSAYYLSCNRNKRAVALDLATGEGQAVFQDLVKRSDIVLENFRPDSAEKLGLSPETLFQSNSRLIVCSISGFGRNGPMKDVPGYDFAIQGLSGLMSITGPAAGPPSKVGVAVSDVLTGLYATSTVLACLHAREKSGHGYAIDLALLDCALAAQVNVVQAFLTTGKVPPRLGNAHLQIVPYQLFQTADDWLVLAIGNDEQWMRFCHAANRPDLASDERFVTNRLRVQHRDELISDLEELFRTKTSTDWEALLRTQTIPHARVWDYADLFQQEQLEARGMRIKVTGPDGTPIDLLGAPFQVAGAEQREPLCPPSMGEHTDAVLGEVLGMSQDRLAELRSQGVIA